MAYSALFWSILAYSGLFYPILAYSTLFWPILAYSGLFSAIQACSGLLCPILAHFGVFCPLFLVYPSLFCTILVHSDLFWPVLTYSGTIWPKSQSSGRFWGQSLLDASWGHLVAKATNTQSLWPLGPKLRDLPYLLAPVGQKPRNLQAFGCLLSYSDMFWPILTHFGKMSLVLNSANLFSSILTYSGLLWPTLDHFYLYPAFPAKAPSNHMAKNTQKHYQNMKYVVLSLFSNTHRPHYVSHSV